MFLSVLNSHVLDEVLVATDDQRIFDVVEQYGGTAMQTSKEHDNGIVRAHEVSEKIPCDIVAIINGDEALLNPNQIDAGVAALKKSDAPVSLLFNDYYKKNSPSDFKVVVNAKKSSFLLRSQIAKANIPFIRWRHSFPHTLNPLNKTSVSVSEKKDSSDNSCRSSL